MNKRRNNPRSTSKPTSLLNKQEGKSPEGILRMLLHDIQNHLQAIRMEIDLLALESNQKLDFGRMIYAIDGASLSLQDVGEYFSLQELSVSEQHAECILEDVVTEFQNGLLEQGVNLRLLTGQSLPLVLVDADKFRSVLQRIIEFCKTLLREGGELEVEGLALRQHGTQKLEVRFSICSIEPFEFEGGDPFSPFLRVNGHKIGIGLALAKEILKHLHAQLSFTKTHPERAIITITLESQE